MLFHDPHLVLISDSLLTGVYGLLLLGSVLIGKPVTVVLVVNMVMEVANQLPDEFNFSQPDYLDRALDALGRLYGGTITTYRSGSVRAQLDLNSNVQQAVDKVRTYRNMDRLH